MSNNTITIEIDGTAVIVCYPQESVLMRWDESINSIAAECKGECLGTGTCLMTMERDLEFEFPTVKQAEYFKKRISLFADTIYTKKREF